MFPDGPVLAGTRMYPFWILLELKMMELVVTTGAQLYEVQTYSHIVTTNSLYISNRNTISRP